MLEHLPRLFSPTNSAAYERSSWELFMNHANGVESPIFTASSAGTHCDAASLDPKRETLQSGMDSQGRSRRYSDSVELSQGRNGESAMSANYQALTVWGYSIIWTSGEYCQANRDERDVTFRWNGERWLEL
jgi:hypothetical protein